MTLSCPVSLGSSGLGQFLTFPVFDDLGSFEEWSGVS